MNKKQLREYITYYQPYATNNPKWVDRYIKVAPFKAERTIKILSKFKGKNARILDCGCGIGLSLYYISMYFPLAEGIETDRKNFEIAKKQFKKLNCSTDLKLYNGGRLPYPDNYFDIVVSMEVWEHAKDTKTMLKEINRVLKSDGLLHITTANKLWPIEPHYKLPFLSYLPYKIADWYVKRSGRADYYHDIHLPTYSEFKKSVEEYFFVDDITLDVVINYKEVGLDKERGRKIILISSVLKIVKSFEKIPIISFAPKGIFFLLSRISLGWLFIARPKKTR